jgi:predicted sulfurtransferase
VDATAHTSAHTSHAVLFYKYTRIDRLHAAAGSDAASAVDGFIASQRGVCARLGLLGRLLIGDEGLNGALCCPGCADSCTSAAACPLGEFMEQMGQHVPSIDWKLSDAPGAAHAGNLPAPFFSELSVKRVNEIVATNRAAVAVDASGDIAGGGKHLSPAEWHAALQQADAADTVLVDVRNTFEHAIGTFVMNAPGGAAAIEPGMRAFTEFEDWCDGAAGALRGKKVPTHRRRVSHRVTTTHSTTTAQHTMPTTPPPPSLPLPLLPRAGADVLHGRRAL